MPKDDENDEADIVLVEVILLAKDWQKEKYPDRHSFEEELDEYLFDEDNEDASSWLESVGSGSGLGLVDVTYETSDPQRFLAVARKVLQRMDVPKSTRISISDEEGETTEYAVYEV
jgi:hypothetical protein